MLSWTSQDCQSFQEYFRETKTIWEIVTFLELLSINQNCIEHFVAQEKFRRQF